MNSNLKLLPAALLVAMLALAGCGGGSGSDNTTTESTEAGNAAMMEMQEADKAIADANAAARALTESSDAEAVTAAEGLIATAEMEIADLSEAEQMAAMKELADAKRIVSGHKGRVTAEGERDDETERADNAEEELTNRDEDDVKEQGMTAQKMAANLLGVLRSLGTDDPPTEGGTGDPSTVMSVDTGYEDADMKDSMTVSIMGEKFSEQYKDNSDSQVSSVDTSNSKLTLDISAVQTRIMGDAFSTDALKTHKHDKVRDDGITPYFSTMGSYHGVMGTYECTGTCSSIVPPTGKGLTLTGTWTFTPSSPANPVSDLDALEYGWWATGPAGSVTEAHAFYAGESLVVIAGGLPTTHGGKATYKGGAMGQYAIHRGKGGMNDSGSFTADAELTAIFGTGTEAGISGTIDGFMGADGESRDWEVTLKNLATHNSGVYSGMDNVVWKIGENSSTDGGRWEVATFGTAAGATSGAPPAVAGGFQAEHTIANGHMIGAFGADME